MRKNPWSTALLHRPRICIPQDTCLGDGDCTSGFCSFCAGSPGVCRPAGYCECEGDCPAGNDFCSVVAPRTCVEDGKCAGDADCSGPTSFCCSTDLCIQPNKCCKAQDCAPGYDCDGNGDCVNTGTPCTTNASVPNTGQCAADQLYCCPAGETCCRAGERCGPAGFCVPLGGCDTSADCLSPLTCQGNPLSCEGTACTGGCSGGCQGDCAAGELCSADGGCIPDDRCAASADCNDGEFCTGDYDCHLYCGCGCTPYQADIVPPNMLVVLDRSGSMGGQIGTTGCQRWKTAVEAIALVTFDHSSEIRFGLNVFPGTGSTSCLPGDTVCTGCANCYPGTVQVPIGDTATTRPLITNFLCGDTCANGDCPGSCDGVAEPCPDGTGPGGYTPTGPTMIHLRNNAAGAGLADTARPNYAMLVTDGEANCDNDAYSSASPDTNSDVECSATTGDPDTQARLNHYLRGLAGLTPPVQTFVVGFAFGGISNNLNCNAVNGGRSRCGDDAACAQFNSQDLCRTGGCSVHTLQGDCDAAPNCKWNTGTSQCDARYGGCYWDIAPVPDVCVGVNSANCSSMNARSGTCYYPADSAAELSSTFDNIAGEIASCTYSIVPAPPNWERVFVYLDYGANPLPPECNGENPCRLERGGATWTGDSVTDTVQFHEPTCSGLLRAGVASPIVVVGCCRPGIDEGC